MKEQGTNRQMKDNSICDREVSIDFNLGMTSDQDLSVDITNESNDQVNHYVLYSRISTYLVSNSVTNNTPILSSVSNTNLSTTRTIDLTFDT